MWFFKLLGKDGTSQQAVDSKHFAARISGRPAELGARGSYSLGTISGVIPAALTANSEIFQFRWSHATYRCLIRSIKFSASVTTTMFAAGVPVQITGTIARAWTGDGSGGTAYVFSTANTNKKATAFPLSAMSDTGCRIITTAALGPGTKTLDTNAFCSIMAGGPITAALQGTIVDPGTMLWQRNTHDEYPINLAQNEGIVIRALAVPATGTWMCAVHIEWDEIDPTVVDGWT